MIDDVSPLFFFFEKTISQSLVLKQHVEVVITLLVAFLDPLRSRDVAHMRMALAVAFQTVQWDVASMVTFVTPLSVLVSFPINRNYVKDAFLLFISWRTWRRRRAIRLALLSLACTKQYVSLLLTWGCVAKASLLLGLPRVRVLFCNFATQEETLALVVIVPSGPMIDASRSRTTAQQVTETQLMLIPCHVPSVSLLCPSAPLEKVMPPFASMDIVLRRIKGVA